jgi:cytosine/adenosine deaminase-related metal-dependent hydrolase
MITIDPVKAAAATSEKATAAIEKQRDDALSAGFLHNGFLYHCDPTFQSQLQAFLVAWQVGMLAPTATVSIRRHDNVTETMTKDQVETLCAALALYVQEIYTKSWQAKDSLQ